MNKLFLCIYKIMHYYKLKQLIIKKSNTYNQIHTYIYKKKQIFYL